MAEGEADFLLSREPNMDRQTGFMKIKRFYASKDYYPQSKNSIHRMEKRFANHASDKGLTSQIHILNS